MSDKKNISSRHKVPHFLLIIVCSLWTIFFKTPLVADEHTPKKNELNRDNATKMPQVSSTNLEEKDAYEHKISRVTFTLDADETNVKSTYNAQELIFETQNNSGKNIGIFSFQKNNSLTRNVILSNNASVRHPTYDASGQNIYFTTIQENKNQKAYVLMFANKDNFNNLYLVPLKSSDEITSIAVSVHNDVAFSQETPKGSIIRIVNTDKNYQYDLTAGKSMNWSSDGNRLVFINESNNARNEIFIINKDGSHLVQLTHFTGDATNPCFSPDNQWICFSGISKSASNSNEKKKGVSNQDIFVLNIKDARFIQLTHGEGSNIAPFWAKDGHIYFSSNRFGNYEIMKIQPLLK